jgi:hypothetical protein
MLHGIRAVPLLIEISTLRGLELELLLRVIMAIGSTGRVDDKKPALSFIFSEHVENKLKSSVLDV